MLPIKPLAIVSCSYCDLNGDVKTFPNGEHLKGLFVVLLLNSDRNTCLAAKITSNKFLSSNLVVILPQRDVPVLRTDSILQMDKLHTLNSKRCEVLGYINNISVYRNIQNCIIRLKDVILDELNYAGKGYLTHKTHYSSPNKARD